MTMFLIYMFSKNNYQSQIKNLLYMKQEMAKKQLNCMKIMFKLVQLQWIVICLFLMDFKQLKKIKAIASERQENVKIIGYSGLMNEEEIKKCKDSGMDECLQKPCPESMLFERVLQQLQNQ
eukprot:TRINITY_DN6827_c0_g1_i1.p3 TRINITY_DN6827_c0_g1~~TRINITY_DN6827_c0_g1_i1.p3  ORF type:complete len:121 (+),score=21.22 TRINITY_DN6827_c0_g1_i1:419-781(+)